MAKKPPVAKTHFDEPNFAEWYEYGEPEPGEMRFSPNKMSVWTYDSSSKEYYWKDEDLPF